MSDNQFYIHCGSCGHEWVAFETPLELNDFNLHMMKAAGKAPCPKCGAKGPLTGRSPTKAAERLAQINADASITERAAAWGASGDTGISSEALCSVMLGRDPRRDWGYNYPHDPSDLGRCLRLLDKIPEWASRISEMAKLSPEWAALVARWEEIAATMVDEVGIDWSKGREAPKTYALMKSVLRPVEDQRSLKALQAGSQT
jgi:hypothetical protein